MLFNTPEYFVFLAIIALLYYSLTHRLQNRMLLVASYVFYAFWDYRFLSLILLTTTVDYFVAHAMQKAKTSKRRRIFLIFSLSVNLGILGFFKYFNFFIDNAQKLTSLAGFHTSIPVLYILLPVGVSFYTFQEIAYTVEVYRGKVKPVDNFLDFALYVCYFPQLVAGPIERPQNMLPQFLSPRKVTADQLVSGGVLILIGLFRKVVIADAIGSLIDPVFSNPGNYSSPELLKALYLFALQIYCDFAGYSDIARGTSRLLGIELMRNFDHPYFASSITEFWRRWHISLSTWLRDYLYIPLGGNRRGTFNAYRNTMITMLLSGLWHGAGWSFVAWGGLHGLYSAGERLRTRKRGTSSTASSQEIIWSWRRVAGVLVTFHLVLLSWVFFRSPGFGAGVTYLRDMAAFKGMEQFSAVLPGLLIPWILCLAIDIPQHLKRDEVFLLRWPKTKRDLGLAFILFLIILGVGRRAPFIYFQF